MAGHSLALLSLSLISLLCLINVNHCAYQDQIRAKTENSTEAAFQKWQQLEKKVMEMAKSLTKTIMPNLVRVGSDADISPMCTRAVFKLISGMEKGELWAMRMLDASGKPVSGVLEGTLSSFGSYSECVNIIAPDAWIPKLEAFRGKYCLLRLRLPLSPKPKLFLQWIKPEEYNNLTLKTEVGNYLLSQSGTFHNVAVQLGLCVPSACTNGDIKNFTSYIGKQMNIDDELFSCETKQDSKKLDSDQIAVFITIAIFVLVTVTATLVQTLPRKDEEKSSEKSIPNTRQKVVEALSIKTNIIKTLDTSNGPKDETFSCLNGMKTISLLWVIVIHVYALMDPLLYREARRSAQYSHTFSFQLITSGSLSVDTFFFITGILVTYQVVSLVDKKGMRAFNIPIMIVRRLWRLIPSAMMTLGLVVILPLLNEGPVWKNETHALLEPTRKNWWTVLISVSNFLKFHDMPMVSIWYIAADVQFFFMAIILLVIFFRKPKAAFIIMGVLFTLSMILSGALMCFEHLTPVFLLGAPDRELVFDVFFYGHTLPHNHVSVYILGMLVGIYFARYRDTIKFPKWLVLASYPTFLAILFAAVFSGDAFTHDSLPTSVETFVFASFYRAIWGIGLAIMTFLCATKNGGWINDILSWKGFLALNRLTYLVYLLHVLFVTYIFGSTLGVMDIADHLLVYLCVGCIGLTFAGAFVMRIIFEAPISELEKILWDNILGMSKPREKKTENGKEESKL